MERYKFHTCFSKEVVDHIHNVWDLIVDTANCYEIDINPITTERTLIVSAAVYIPLIGHTIEEKNKQVHFLQAKIFVKENDIEEELNEIIDNFKQIYFSTIDQGYFIKYNNILDNSTEVIYQYIDPNKLLETECIDLHYYTELGLFIPVTNNDCI